MSSSYLWTSEAVSSGHPDKVADQVADALLDAYLGGDPTSRVAVEITICKDLILVTGEVTSDAKPDVEKIVRTTICNIGYNSRDKHFDGNTVEILNRLNKQSPQIAAAVTRDGANLGAGDQGIMFGFACDETANYMPLAHALSFKVINLLEDFNKNSNYFLPDAKSQVTVEYEDGECPVPKRVDTILVSTCHRDINLAVVRGTVMQLLQGKIPLVDAKTKYVINPAGSWTVGGPAADTGLSGRKIVVDNYGADCPIGGGSFSGKDPTKVDRSAAYAARHVAKNIVAAGIAKRAQVQISYAIGVVEPTSLRVQTPGTLFPSKNTDAALTQFIRENVDLTPSGILGRLNLRRPIYRNTASGGHFGRDIFPWEELNLVSKFKGFSP